HIISFVAWFSGLFYLPRLFVYHAMTEDKIGIERFKIMEYKLLYYITIPAAILTIIFGVALLYLNLSYYLQQNWMHAKLGLVALLLIYQGYLVYLLKQFKKDQNQYSDRFYR